MAETGTREKLRDRAYTSFTEHLLASTVRPGQFVSQRELVALTGMPLGAIRELVPRLEAEGLITTVPQRGMQVAAIDARLVRDAYQFRLALEKEAVAAFARSATDTEIAAIAEAHRSILARVEDGETGADLTAEAQAVDWGFHDTIIDRLGNEIISKAHRVNSIKIRLIRQELTRIDGHIRPAMREHMKVIEALEARDAGAAVAALTDHIETARNRALGLSQDG